MPIVHLIDYTGKGFEDGGRYAARLLAYTKNTRLNLTPEGFEVWLLKPWEDIEKELEYMAGTIPSSWEFADLTFSLQEVSRATAQQVTRSRNASFAMQSQRVTDMRSVTWDKGRSPTFDERMRGNVASYILEVDSTGTSLEDARDLLPMGVHSNLIAKYNLRALVELVRKRKSLRVQGPFVSIVEAMERETLRVWPWAATFFEPPNAKAIKMIEEVARRLQADDAKYGKTFHKQDAIDLAKAADLLKSAE